MNRKINSLALVLAVLLAGALASPAAAASTTTDCGDLDDLIGACESDGGKVSALLGYALGVQDRASNYVSHKLDEDPESADTLAQNLSDEFNANSADYVSYANNLTDPSTSLNVIRVDVKQNGETATRYLIADLNSNETEVEAAMMKNSTSRAVDTDVVLSGSIARMAAAELDNFHAEFVLEDKTPSASYLAKMHGKYGNSLSGDLADKYKDKIPGGL